ncbi:MAG: hypothetical protein KatS3mg085_083 [Candidatus Dojkabacteria bacterium]|nr:MAG: hypothetical protein KatS3mg085_083 [Candidatus Dojkabacteria bacterium]
MPEIMPNYNQQEIPDRLKEGIRWLINKLSPIYNQDVKEGPLPLMKILINEEKRQQDLDYIKRIAKYWQNYRNYIQNNSKEIIINQLKELLTITDGFYGIEEIEGLTQPPFNFDGSNPPYNTEQLAEMLVQILDILPKLLNQLDQTPDEF